MKRLSSFLLALSLLFTLSISIIPQSTNALSWDSIGKDISNIFGGGGSDNSDPNECVKKPLSDLETEVAEATKGNFKYSKIGVRGLLSEKQQKEQICVALKNSAEGEESNSPSETFLWKPKSDSDGKAVTLLPSSLRGTVIKTELLTAEHQKIETGRFSGDEHNGMRPHYRFTKPGSSYGSGIQVVAVVPEGAWIWRIPNGGQRFESGKGRFVTNAEMAAWDAMHAANAYNQSLQDLAKSGLGNSSCPAGQTDTNTDKSIRVMAMGDSNTKGTESSSFLSYRKAFKENMLAKGYTVDMVGSQSAGNGLSDNQHEGYPGEGIAKLQQIANGTSLATYNPNVILLLVGSNDMWVSLDNRTPISDTAANSKVAALGTLLDTIHTKLPNAKIVVAKPATPSTGSMAATRPLGIYKNGIDTLASNRSYVSVVDFTGLDNDGVHYTSAGYNSIAQAFANKVDEITRKCTATSTPANGYTTKASCEAASGFVCQKDPTYVCNDTPSATSTSQNICADKWIPTTTKLPTSGGKLTVECNVSDTTPGVDDEIEIWAEVSGGTTPYNGKWSGDYKKADGFDKDSVDQTVSFERKGSYKIKVSVTDGNDDKDSDSCPTIKVTEDGEDDDVIVRVEQNTAPVNSNTSVSNYPYYRDLTVGVSGPDVTALQQYLVGQGFLVMPIGVAYGYFGEVTRAAVARWQTAMGISPAAGYFGARSRAAISGGSVIQSPTITYTAPSTPTVAPTTNSCVDLTETIYFGEENANVTKIQQFLVAQGHLVMPTGVSYGYYGKSTVTALSKFMSSRGFNHQGAIVDQKILTELKAASCQ